MLDKHSIKQHVEQLEDRFLQLTECTYEVLVEKRIDIHRLRARLVSLDVSRRHEHREFINKHLMKIDQRMTLTDLWARLGDYWDFLNFDLLDHVVSRFGNEDLKKEMKSYKCDLQSFRNATRLCDFIDCWPVRGQSPPETELKDFVAKVGRHWDTCTLEDLETLKGAITRKFFLPEFVLRLREVKEGCITIIWHVPEQFVEVLQVAVESTSSEFFLEQKIVTITIDGQECYSSSMKAKKYVREKCVDEISQHVKLLPSPEQYLSTAEVEADPSLPTKYKDYLSSTPAIRATLYTTFNAKLAAEVFTWSQHTESPPPTTKTELFTAFTLKTLVDHLSTHPVYYKQQLKVTTFSDLPTDVYKQFQDLCRMAYVGLNRQQLVFSAAHLPTGFAPLSLMQEVPQLYTEGRASSYHFIHLTLQEYLAAVHISQLPAHEQTRLFQEHVNSGHFKMTIRFLAGLTKLANIPCRIPMVGDTELNYFHVLFEAKDISVTNKILGSDKIIVYSHYSWAPLDYYVTGHAISHSNGPWSLRFRCSSIDNDKFALFCQGCAASGGTGCRGHISYLVANFSNNDITSESIQSFVNIPPHILQDMIELDLSRNKLDGSACDLLAKALSSMSKLEKLDLSDNPIASGGAMEVIKALCGSRVKILVQKQLQALRLYNTGIGVPDCEALCELLKSGHMLRYLDIDRNNLSSENVANIITGLSHNHSLTALNISNSHFNMANVVSLASILRDQSKCTLTWLVLRDCHISGQGASKLAAALCKNSTLQYLYLDHNPIGVEGASSMSDLLQHNTSLKELTLCDDSIGEEGVHQLINSLKHNQTLRELWLPVKYKTETSDHRIDWLVIPQPLRHIFFTF